MTQGVIQVATCQFAESFSPARNAATVRRQMAKARQLGADIAHFHEACLTGYLTRDEAPRFGQYDRAVLKEAVLSICEQARKLKMWALVGSAHPLTPPHKPTNCLYLIGPDGRIRDRYDKRFCTRGDLNVYQPGNRVVTFSLHGVKCALLICFELRFPEIYRELKKLGVQAVFQSFHNGYMDGPGPHNNIMRQTVQAHAGINYFWISANNSSGYYSRWPSVFIQPDGTIIGSLRQNAAGVMVNAIDTRKVLYDASAGIRDAAMKGVLHSGQLVSDPRLSDARSL